MPTIKYGNVKDVETDFKQAPIGVWRIKAADVSPKTKEGKGEMVEVRFEVTYDSEGKKVKENYASVFYYAPLSIDDWGGEPPHPSWLRRLKELVLAFDLKATGGDLGKIEGKSCLARFVKDEDEDGEYRPKIAKLMSLKSAVDEDEEGEEDEEDGEEEDEDEVDLDELSRKELKAFIKEQELEVRVMQKDSDDEVRDKIREALGEDEDEEDEDDEDEEDDEPVVYTKAQLKKLDRDELKEAAENLDVEFPGRLTAKAKEKLIAAILEAQKAAESDDEDEEDEDEEEEEVDLDSLDRNELKALIKEQELDVKVLRKDDDDALREKVREALGEDDEDEEDEDEEDDDDEDNYEEMSVGDLREECENRELETKGTKKQLVARLRKDDQTDPV